MDVPSHLMQPLSVDTNITYNLDMTLFPGLDDPQHMYQPALFVATDWSQYIADDVTTSDNVYPEGYTDEGDSGILSDDAEDLFSLIESCGDLISSFKPDSMVEPDILDSLLGDVTSEENLSEDSQLLETSIPEEKSRHDVITVSSSRGRKRRRSEASNFQTLKKSRTEESPLYLPHLVLVRSSSSCVLHRES